MIPVSDLSFLSSCFHISYIYNNFLFLNHMQGTPDTEFLKNHKINGARIYTYTDFVKKTRVDNLKASILLAWLASEISNLQNHR